MAPRKIWARIFGPLRSVNQRTVKQDRRQVTKLHPSLRPPPEKFNLLGRRGDRFALPPWCRRTPRALVDDQPAFMKIFRHGCARVRRGVLDVGPIDVTAREFQIGLDRLTRVSGIADDEPADNIHFVPVEGVDGLDGGVANLSALFPPAFLEPARKNFRSSSRMFSMPRKT